MISPQQRAFIDAASVSKKLRQPKKEKLNLKEDHDKISLSSLSQTLVGLQRQALSYRREARDRDYLNEAYKNMVAKGEFLELHEAQDLSLTSKDDYEFVRMERDYLKAWTTFQDGVQKLEKRILKLVGESMENAEDLLFGYRGLCAAKLEAPELREKMNESLLSLLDEQEPRIEALIDGLRGIALQAQHTDKSFDVARKILTHFDRFEGSIDFLRLNFD